MKLYTSPLDKAVDIERVLSGPGPVEWRQLQIFCQSRFGLVTDSLRRQIWPLLLGLCPHSVSPPSSAAHCRFDSLIQVDIVRSLYNFDILKGQSTERRATQAAQLTRLMARILQEDSELHYFQGFHDICTVFLLVAGEDLAYLLVQRFVYTHCRASMKKTFAEVAELLTLSLRILRNADSDLSARVEHLQEEVIPSQTPMFALSWVLTFFAHVIPCFMQAARVFDFCMTDPLAVLYLTASVILLEKPAVEQMKDLPDLHKHFGSVMKTIDWEAACAQAADLMHSQPPSQLLHPQPWQIRVLSRASKSAQALGSFLLSSYAMQYAFFSVK